MATSTEIIQSIESKLGITIDSTSIPSTSDVENYILDGAKDIAAKVDPGHLTGLITQYKPSLVASVVYTDVTLPDDIIKTISLKYSYDGTSSNRHFARHVSLDSAERILYTNNSLLEPTYSDPIWWVSDRLNFRPEIQPDTSGNGFIILDYVKIPTDVSELPDKFFSALVYYGCFSVMMEDEETELANNWFQLYIAELGKYGWKVGK